MNFNTQGVAEQCPSAGAVFHRCALQVNPEDYLNTFQGQESGVSAQSYVEAVVEKADGIGVSVLAITNHNDVSSVSAFREAAANRNITIFPGFELYSSEGVHVLCIYPPETHEEQLGRYLGEFGILEPKPSSDLSKKNFAEILHGVRQRGGITIAAHTTNASGLFKVLGGQPRIQAWQNQDLLAVQIPGSVNDLPDNVRPIVENKNPDYLRTHNAGDNLAVAVVNAKDVTKPEDLADPSATCLIKMSEVTIEGLRQAFLDPDSRIRLNSDPEMVEHTELLSLEWVGGFLGGAVIDFNPNLNVLVGGRGAGKSTVVESLRYVLGLESIGEEARKAHEGMVHHVLRGGTKISLRVRSLHPSKRDYLIERTVPNPIIVRDDSGQISSLLPKDILPRVEIYGQHEISELARSPGKRTFLLKRFVQHDELLDRRKASVQCDLEQTRKSIIDVRTDLERIDDQLAMLPNLEETLVRYQEAGLEGRLQERSLLVREERILDSIPERVLTFRECLETLREELPIDRVFLSERALEDLPGKTILADADPVLERLSNDLEQVANLLGEALERAHQGIENIRSRWGERKSEVEAEYQRILRELQESAVDGEEFIRLRGQIEGLRPLRERRTLLKNLEKEHVARRVTLLAEWEELKAAEFRHLDGAAKTVSGKLSNYVSVEVVFAGDRGPLYDTLRSEIGGRLSEAVDQLERSQAISLPQFVKCCRDGAGEVNKTYSIPPGQAERLAQASPDALMRIEELELPPTTAIRLNTAPAGAPPSWKALDELSTGQRATAVLLLLLLESDAPLIVDQPEDDLDNRFITEGVVPRMREEKRRRQFIFSTHNANIPVLGDAELILGLTPLGEAEGGRATIRPEHIGSIDAPAVRELIEDILEGGKDAFETRRRKYGF